VNLAVGDRVAEKNGYRREGLLRSAYEVRGVREDMVMYSRLPTDPVPV
jgi:RimJ/RimL family protein N-acetyltransferase